MKNADESPPTKDILPDESDLGPEPDWLLDDHDDQEPATGALPDTDEGAFVTQEIAPPPPPPTEPELQSVKSIKSDRQAQPWMLAALPLGLLVITGLIAWVGSSQTLNDIRTWDAIRTQLPPLLPARWAMTLWWIVLPLMGMFLIYGGLPAGREITRIRITGPLMSVALIATGIWIFAQHWEWELIGIASMVLATIAIIASYLLVVLGPNITKISQRMIAVIPLSAALGYSVMLTIITWQSYSSQPFGERGSSALFAFILVMMAAVLAFFLRDGLFGLVLAIWFAGVIHHQWGDDAVISLIAAVTLLFTGALAVLGTILATESHRPSLTTSVETHRGRISFFRKSGNPTENNLP